LYESDLQDKILKWFRENKRPLPWRSGKNWYAIWISEVMLQQTQVDTVIPYYHRFIEKFPTVERLAGASQQDVLKIWEGLGYYSRARNLHQAANIIVSKYDSKLPAERDELLKIPGFGPYTANAVLSLTFNQPHGVMDGNVKRVLSRLYAIREDIRDVKTLNRIQDLMNKLLPLNSPGEFNEAMMELGAIICKSSSPGCTECPLSRECHAYQQNIVDILPYKSQKPSIPSRQSLACIIFQQDQFLIVKRPQHEMLAGLWEFPVLNLNDGKNKPDQDQNFIQEYFNLDTSYLKSWPAIKHTYTHFRFNLTSKIFRSFTKQFQSDFYDDFQWLEIKDIKKLPLHRAIWKVLNTIEEELISITQRDIINS
jgi:A/G-specific adenine glycosylase